jgi:hypothetical protein
MRRNKYLLLASVPLLLLVSVYVWNRFAGIPTREELLNKSERLLKEAVAEIDAADPGWRWNDLVNRRPDLPDEKNLFVQVKRIDRLLGQDFEGHSSGGHFRGGEVATNQLYDAETTEALNRHQARFAPAVDLARQLESLSRGFIPLPAGKTGWDAIGSSTTDLMTIRSTVLLLR